MPSGCFQIMGKLFSNGLMVSVGELYGAVEEGLGLSAVITTTLIRSGLLQSDPVLQKALKCRKDLVNADPGSSSLYSQARVANAFALVGDEVMRKKNSKRIGSISHPSRWTQQPKPKEGSMYWYRAPSVDVELTSSILMVHFLKPNLSSADIGKASQIVSWLTKQQNPYGGFASTQDTVVALEALALYALKTYSKDGPDLPASISSEGFSHEIQVDTTNRLLLQTAQLPAIPSSYTVQAQGHGCLFLQTTLRYNIPPPRSDLTFALSVRTECIGLNAARFPVTIQSRYTGNRVSTNVVLIKVKMLSGYSPVTESLEELKKMPVVKKIEREVEQVTLYLDE
ncbi:unnamed protein product, partial [Eretmochelys imbricata]